MAILSKSLLGRSASRWFPSGESDCMREVRLLSEKVAGTGSTVLLLGASGCGKERVAHHIHGLSPRAARPFVNMSCGAVQPEMLAEELFGTETACFLRSSKVRAGYFERATGGTLFLTKSARCPPRCR